MVRDPSIVSPTLTGVFIGGGVITNTVQDRGARCSSSVVPPLLDGDGGVTDRATRGACSAGSGVGRAVLTSSMGELHSDLRPAPPRVLPLHALEGAAVAAERAETARKFDGVPAVGPDESPAGSLRAERARGVAQSLARKWHFRAPVCVCVCVHSHAPVPIALEAYLEVSLGSWAWGGGLCFVNGPVGVACLTVTVCCRAIFGPGE